MKKDRGRVPKDYRAFINFVKAFAIIWIFSYHALNARFMMRPFSANFARNVTERFFVDHSGLLSYLKGACVLLFYKGHLGVELFLVASGFGLYLSHLNRPATWGRFYARRAVRIVPLYWAGLLVYYFVGMSLDITPGSLLQSMFFVQVYTKHYLDFGPMWFIGGIVFMYLLFPLFVRAFERRATRWGLVALSFALYPLSLWLINATGAAYGGVVLTRYIPVFVLGMLVARSVHDGTRLHRIVSPNVILSLLAFAVYCAVFVAQSYHRAPLALEADNVLAIAMYLSLGLPYLVIRRVFTERAIGFVSAAAYVTFLLHMQWQFVVASMAIGYNLVHYRQLPTGVAQFTSHYEFIVMSLVALITLVPAAYLIQAGYDRLVGVLRARLA